MNSSTAARQSDVVGVVAGAERHLRLDEETHLIGGRGRFLPRRTDPEPADGDGLDALTPGDAPVLLDDGLDDDGGLGNVLLHRGDRFVGVRLVVVEGDDDGVALLRRAHVGQIAACCRHAPRGQQRQPR
jgi:hypothetical protein